MGLNIKTEEAHRLAKELSELTGESMAKAVTDTIRQRVEELRRERTQKARAEEIMRIARECSKLLNETPGEMMKIEDLYDEKTGLPK
ncbi:MAG TPA: type II toxin-antitoxin system VapB family antitoxin [Rhizomicrobium sp.]|nr:type II toxin-antitoxin system VapB family antitoxin [Rhizomicrobium sp.]